MLENKKALLFDLDGTLLDTMMMWSQIDVDYLKRFGIERPEGLERELEGIGFLETAHYFKKRFKIEDSIEKILADWEEMAYDEYRYRVEMKPGAYEFLKTMHEQGMKMAIATSNAREMTLAGLERFKAADWFEQIVTAADVPRSKPAPDIYLEAAGRLGVKPEECLVFEDIPAGIRAGKSAGMKVCAVRDEASWEQKDTICSLADYYIEDYSQILNGTFMICQHED